MAEQKTEVKEISIEKKLKALYDLQLVSSKIDKIKILRGELPLEVQDLEDEIVGLQTRITKFDTEISEISAEIEKRKKDIVDFTALIEKYKSQIDNVRKNR